MADTWLENLRQACGHADTQLFVVPGNHDCDRGLAGRPVNRSIRDGIKRAEKPRTALSAHLRDSAAAEPLMAPLAAFNQFAAKYFCDLSPPARTTAVLNLPLTDTLTIRIVGFNSAILSSWEDSQGVMMLDESCFNIPPEPGVETIAICHHPPNWLREGSELQSALDEFARVQLFGHEHAARQEIARDYIRAFAGAVRPERDKPVWRPGYNIIDLEHQSNQGVSELVVTLRVLAWQSSPGRFTPIFDRTGEPFFTQRFKTTPRKTTKQTPPPQTKAAPRTLDADEAFTMPTPIRQVFQRFLRYNLSDRRAIAAKLQILNADEESLSDSERYRRVLRRAAEQGKIDNLILEMDSLDARKQ